MIQSNFGNMGSFEVLVREGNRLRHYWRNNEISSHPWTRGALFGSDIDSAPAMIQSSFGNMGNFEVVVKEGEQLRHYWRNNDASGLPWNRGVLFGSNVDSAPAMIQSNFGNMGNFEVVVKEGEQLRHYWRNNDASGLPWNSGVLFGSNVDSAPAMIQSNYGNMGNFEVVVKEGEQLRHYWRNNDISSHPWNRGALFSDHITLEPSLIQSGFGNMGNFEVVTKRGNCFVHFWRNNDSGSGWSDEKQTHVEVRLVILQQRRRKLGSWGRFQTSETGKLQLPAQGSTIAFHGVLELLMNGYGQAAPLLHLTLFMPLMVGRRLLMGTVNARSEKSHYGLILMGARMDHE